MGTEPEALEGFEVDAGMSTGKRVALGVGALLVFVAILGAVTQMAGVGFLGYRSILYGSGELYVLNLSDEERFVQVEGREPEPVLAQNAQIVELIGGTSKVDILNADKSLWKSYDVRIDDSAALLNISHEACLAVADVTSLYRGQDEGLSFQKLLDASTEFYALDSHNVIWPRRSFPARIDPSKGPTLWVEIVACRLFDDPNYLSEYLMIRLQQRMEKRGQAE
ncbi:hypothetical protein FRC91_16295 [Bradymonadales bacterium TMQ1]|uniref:POTRA domain-containing protein n=1 Tax=Lujinxingia sediminis TaxID=2480984 RepID=A0ABY0CPU7_9DELT|nr:hypothetical protein [Lujinxingia sediminis]RVU42472.1 hypothetical protein EA187_16475 [Lujinxingia sediminis]TXC74671.1 hypothetical protein FRC91_16295 [Bradymonadales bacterium TMQ1]